VPVLKATFADIVTIIPVVFDILEVLLMSSVMYCLVERI
jgi:hypothetical protein